uniref:NADH-ubiquinone oxidoreductase chain 2 n=1 Tax=Lasioderma serricorne TaxID=295660 RepID=A0A343SQN5_9COLE|nr:NADH dehydrogenase subunit 2 [Lasioderma serricorne]AUR43718.1 NADH dehydrogenase subunit 2 [Lasioderma serricorne]AWY13613.1 NADH dehydrogenase subunit 2 [Lasioderma serricorne]QYH50914.1 NADH dehydrogenase subunit 2 [Lasioderma serricorne]
MFSKLLFLIFLILGTLMSICSYSWMGMWMGLEINLLSIIPLMNNKNLPPSSESSLKYFITQALASVILLYSLIMMSEKLNSFMFDQLNFTFIMNISLLIKMGAAPFHYWFPEIMSGLDWFSSFLVLTWQKIAPMMILLMNIFSMNFIFFVIIISMLVGGIQGLNQTSIQKILAYSSINHIGWMLGSLIISFNIWLIYFIIYTMISVILLLIFNYYKIYFISQFISQFKMNKLLKLTVSLNFLSLGGLPPFIGFFPKWLVINMLTNNGFMFMSVMMVILTLFILYYYVRFIISSMIIDFSSMNFFYKFNFKMFSYFLWFNMINLLGLLMIIFFYNYS